MADAREWSTVFSAQGSRIKRERESSGVASGQVKATKYVVFPNAATSFFAWTIGFFHEKRSISEG